MAKHVIPHLAERFLKKMKNPFLMYGFKTRSFCYVDDAVTTIVVAENPNSNGQIYHIVHLRRFTEQQ